MTLLVVELYLQYNELDSRELQYGVKGTETESFGDSLTTEELAELEVLTSLFG